jgi:hypothetical protein
MAAVVADNAPLLKEHGLRKRRHSFNRPVKDRIVHQVNFWMAPNESPAWTEVPGLRERSYGTFRVDFGVYVPEMNRMHTPSGPWINDYDCNLRRTMGQLMLNTDAGVWWQSTLPTSPPMSPIC